MRKIATSLLLFVLALVGFTVELYSVEPETVYWESSQLSQLKSQAVSLDKENKIALSNLRQNADEALRRGPYSVTFKNDIPPSNDKHDYMSFSRYWWPNPNTENGLPYIRRDGRVNVELRQRGDRDQIGMLVEDVESLALAAYLFNDDKYADHALNLIRAWFLDPATKMNPHLRYGQSVPGRSEGRGVGIIDTRGFIRLLDAIALLDSMRTLKGPDSLRLRRWFSDYLNWLLHSELGKDEAKRENNHGSWYAAQVTRIALFVGKESVARRIAENVINDRVPAQFSSDGSQPAELERTQSLHYSLFNLEALSVVARVGEKVGINLWEPSPNGSLRPGIAFLLPYVEKTKQWRYPQIKEYTLSRGAKNLLRMASVRYDDTDFSRPLAKATVKYPEKDYSSLVFRSKNSSFASLEPVITVNQEAIPNPPKFELPDISSSTAQAVRDLVPLTQSGKAQVGPSEGEPALSEAFRRDRGKDLQRRQGTQSTRVIKITEGTVSLHELARQLGEEEILRIDNGIAMLRLPILVQPGATLVIDEGDCVELRLSTDRGVFIANAGTLFILDSKVTSWEEKESSPTLFSAKAEFRPFISSYLGSKTYLANSKFLHLGFHAPTAYGISLSSEPEREDPSRIDDWPTGQIIENEFHGLYYGFYSFEAKAVKIIGNKYDSCVLYGIDPHDRSAELVIARNLTMNTVERHGIIGSRGVSNSFIFENVSRENTGSGIMLDRQCIGNVVCNNKVYGNGQGIAVYESPYNVIANNLVIQNKKSGIRVRNSVEIDVYDNQIVGNGDYGVEVSAKRLKDHQKRSSRGDTYVERVSLRLFRNIATGNRGGLIKGNNVSHLLLSDIRLNANLQNLESTTGIEKIRLYESNDEFFGSQLKMYASELERVFEEGVQVVEYRH